MYILYVSEPKNILEVIAYPVDFSDMLTSGDTINNNEILCTVTLFSGTDPSPSLMLYGLPNILGNIVTQNIQAGTPGNIYVLETQVGTTLGYTYSKATRIAVLPLPGNAVPQFIPAYLTSKPYPYFYSEQYQCSKPQFIGGILELINVVYSNWPIESYNTKVPTFVGGTFQDILITYTWPPETYNSGIPTFIGGTFEEILVHYSNWPAEAYNANAAFIGGTLTVGNVIYSNYQPEAYNAGIPAFVGGTLVL